MHDDVDDARPDIFRAHRFLVWQSRRTQALTANLFMHTQLQLQFILKKFFCARICFVYFYFILFYLVEFFFSLFSSNGEDLIFWASAKKKDWLCWFSTFTAFIFCSISVDFVCYSSMRTVFLHLGIILFLFFLPYSLCPLLSFFIGWKMDFKCNVHESTWAKES